MKRLKIALPVALLATVLLAGCQSGTAGTAQPKGSCNRLPKPTAAEIAAARGGAEVERTVSQVECIVLGTRWVQDR